MACVEVRARLAPLANRGSFCGLCVGLRRWIDGDHTPIPRNRYLERAGLSLRRTIDLGHPEMYLREATLLKFSPDGKTLLIPSPEGVQICSAEGAPIDTVEARWQRSRRESSKKSW